MGNVAKGATTSPSPTGPCGDPQGAERSRRAWAAVPGPASAYSAESCRWYTAERALIVTPAETWPVSTPPATLRWLDTKDHRGSTKTDSITYGPADLEFLSQNGIARRSEARPKCREVHGHDNLFDDGTIDAGWAAKVRHPRWKERSKDLDSREHKFQRARARRIRLEARASTTAAWPPKIDHQRRMTAKQLRERGQDPHNASLRAPTDAVWPKAEPSLAARARWKIDRDLDYVAARASRLAQAQNRHLSVDDDQTWARSIGVKEADRLLARELARRRVEARLDAYLNRRKTPSELALDRLAPVVRRVAHIARRRWSEEFVATLHQQFAVDLARRDPGTFTWLSEADETGATEIPKYVVAAVDRALGRVTAGGGSRTLALDLAAVLHGRAGDGQRVLEAAAALTRGFRAARARSYRKQNRDVAPREYSLLTLTQALPPILPANG